MEPARPASLPSTMRRPRVPLALGALALLAAVASVGVWPAPARPQDSPAPATPPATPATPGAATPAPATSAASARLEQHRARFHGVWRLTVPQDRARQVVDGAIEQTVNAMNFFVRGIARDQLRDNTPLNRRIDLVFHDDERITVVFDQRHRYTTRIGRQHRFRTPDGDALRVVQRLREDGRLEQVFETDRGTRWNVFESTGDGQLRVEATTQGMMMPQPLFFTLDYRRDP